MTLRVRFAIAATSIVTVLVLLVLTVPGFVERAQQGELDRQLVAELPAALHLASLSTAGSPGSTPKNPLRFSDLYLARFDNGARIVLLNAANVASAPLAPAVATHGHVSAVIVTVGSFEGSGRWRAELVRRGHQDDVLAALPLAVVDSTVATLREALFVAGGAIVVLIAALWWWVLRLGLLSIARAVQLAEAITTGQRGRRLKRVGGRTEGALLTQALNDMLDEEHQREERLQRFLADASHELRTPVTVVQGVADLWRHCAVTDEVQRDDAMRRVGLEAARMGALVDDLLQLARLDAHAGGKPELVDISALLHAVTSEADDIKNHPLAFEVEEGLLVLGYPELLRRAIANLLRNAAVHTPSATARRLSARRDQARVVIDVHDDGPGLSEEEVAHAFERFWRAPEANHHPGSGLGLAIVADIVAEHGGTASIDSAPERGTTITLTLQIADPAGSDTAS